MCMKCAIQINLPCLALPCPCNGSRQKAGSIKIHIFVFNIYTAAQLVLVPFSHTSVPFHVNECKFMYSVSLHVAACECTCAAIDFHNLCLQIHKQAPPLEDVPESCSPAMRRLLKHALDRVPAQRSSATELLNEEALHPSREDQPRCWSLDSALEEGTHPLLRQHSQLSDSTQGTSHNTQTCCFLWFTGTLHRRNGFYTVQTVCAIALHVPYT